MNKSIQSQSQKPGFGAKFLALVKGNPIVILLLIATVVVGFLYVPNGTNSLISKNGLYHTVIKIYPSSV